MQSERSAVFLIDLLQDLNILRPLMLLARRDLAMPVRILVSSAFQRRDLARVWQAELEALVQKAGVTLHPFNTEHEAWQHLSGGHGLLVSASETNQPAHRVNHTIFRIAPAGYLRVTVQHGFECIGFLPNREHVRAYGRNINFAADVICGWCEAEHLTGVVAAERNKLYVTGAPMLLSCPEEGPSTDAHGGLVCENLHSVRLRVSGDFRASFMATFFDFCAAMGEAGERVTLRPHPGGQYFQKNDIELPPMVDVQNVPAYRVDFSRYAYGISAPSTVLLDMLFAGIPTAVWLDERQVMDAGRYTGLPMISTPEEWIAFRHAARSDRAALLANQTDFLRRSGLLTDAAEVRRRFLTLFANGQPAPAVLRAPKPDFDAPHPGLPDEGLVSPVPPARARPAPRILFVCDGHLPSLQDSFLKPLLQLREDGKIDWYVMVEKGLTDRDGTPVSNSAGEKVWKHLMAEFDPDLIVLCRYSGKHAKAIRALALSKQIPTLCYIDDDLLGGAGESWASKATAHADSPGVERIRLLLNECDFVYVPTRALRDRLRERGVSRSLYVGAINCSAHVINRASLRPVTRIGCVDLGRSLDFAVVAPALLRYLDKYPSVTFELVGNVPKPSKFDRFGERFRVVPPASDASQLMDQIAAMNWDIGICALSYSVVNSSTANAKWVEYTSVGAAVVASSGTLYDACISDGCGLLAGSEAEWFDALDRLTADPEFRLQTVQRAQQRVEQDYTLERLRAQVLDVFRRTTEARRRRADMAGEPSSPRRIMFVANARIPTMQLSFLKPLADLESAGEVQWAFCFEDQAKDACGRDWRSAVGARYMAKRISDFKPDYVIFCRYSGLHADSMVSQARASGATMIFHVDDDLLNIPVELGEAKWRFHNQPARLDAVRHLMENAHLIYASTQPLATRIRSQGFVTPIRPGHIYCSGTVINPAEVRPVTRIGYMGFDHSHDFKLAIPALLRFLDANPHITFELFGSIPKPPEFDRLGERVRVVPPVRDYAEFLRHFASLNWDIGICPLADMPFNAVKANTKWVEYTSVGAAVIASAGTIYDECVSGGCGLLAQTDDQWFQALERLTRDPQGRHDMVQRAQRKLEAEYSVPRLREQVLAVLEEASQRAAARPDAVAETRATVGAVMP